MLKLIRDVIPLKPDVVLSYNGFNDLWLYPFQYGRPERKSKPFITDFQIDYVNKLLSKYPEMSRTIYCGLENNKTAPEFWLDNVRMMRSLSNEFDILFLSFLQPFYYIGNYKLTDTQKTIFNRYLWTYNFQAPQFTKDSTDERIAFIKSGAEEMRSMVKDLDYITDLTQIFSEHTNIYRDHVHVTELGNQIIAKNIQQVLVKHLDKGAVQ